MKSSVKKIMINTLAPLFLFCAICCCLSFKNSVKKAKAEETEPFSMVQDAYVRLSNPSGLRFVATMDDYTYNSIVDVQTNEYKTGKSLHMIIVPKAYVSEISDENPDYVSIFESASKQILKFDYPTSKIFTFEGKKAISGAITNIKFNNSNLEFVGIAYIETAGEISTREYASFDVETNSRTIAETAMKAYNSNEDMFEQSELDILTGLVEAGVYQAKGVYCYQDADKTIYYKDKAAADLDTDRQATASLKQVVEDNGIELGYVDFESQTILFNENNYYSIDYSNVIKGIDGSLIEWSSSNEQVATVRDDGVMTMKAIGSTTITATYWGVEHKATYTFEEGVFTPGIGVQVAKSVEDEEILIAKSISNNSNDSVLSIPASSLSNVATVSFDIMIKDLKDEAGNNVCAPKLIYWQGENDEDDFLDTTKRLTPRGAYLGQEKVIDLTTNQEVAWDSDWVIGRWYRISLSLKEVEGDLYQKALNGSRCMYEILYKNIELKEPIDLVLASGKNTTVSASEYNSESVVKATTTAAHKTRGGYVVIPTSKLEGFTTVSFDILIVSMSNRDGATITAPKLIHYQDNTDSYWNVSGRLTYKAGNEGYETITKVSDGSTVSWDGEFELNTWYRYTLTLKATDVEIRQAFNNGSGGLYEILYKNFVFTKA